jgi:O-antigen/teichoic acid export membrane protein
MSALGQLEEPIQEATESPSDLATRNHIRGSGLLVTGYLVELVINFLPHVLLVRYLMTSDYGAWAYALSLIAAFQTFTLCLNDGMQRFVPIYHERQDYGRLLGCVAIAFGSTLVIGSAFVAAFYLLPGPIARFLHEKAATRLLWILVALVPIEAFEVMLMRLFACFHRARLIFYLQHVLAPAIRLVLVLFLIGLHKDLRFLATARVWSAALMTLLYAATLHKLVRQENLLQAFKSRVIFPLREMITFSTPMIVSTALSAIENAVIVLLLDRFDGVAGVAFYRVVLPVALMNNLVMNAFSWLYVPSAARLLAKDDYSGINQLYWRTAGWITVLTFPIFALTFCFAGPLTTLLYGQRYAASGPILAILAIANYSNVALGFNGVTLKVLGKIKYVVTANFFSASLRIFLAVLLIPKFGAVGAAGAFALSMLTYNALMQTGLRLIAGIRALEKQYLPFAALIGLSTVVLFSLRSFTANRIYLAVAFTSILSTIIVFAAKKQLSIGETFPETRRLPLVGRFFA